MFGDPVTFRPHRAPESVIEKRHCVHDNAQQVHAPRTSTPTKNCAPELAGGFNFRFTAPSNDYPTKSSADSNERLLTCLPESHVCISACMCVNIFILFNYLQSSLDEKTKFTDLK